MSAPDPLPTVDAHVPTVDRPELLRRTLAGIRDQDYGGVIRTLVHFDGTPVDQTVASDDPRRPVRVMASPPGRRGLAAARNTMIAATDAELIAFCDDDDAWEPSKVRRQVAVLHAHPETEVVGTGALVETVDGEVVRVPERDVLTIDDLVSSRVSAVPASSLLARRSAATAIGPVDEDLPGGYGEDRDWMIRAARRQPIRVVREPLVRYRWAQQSMFADRWSTIVEAIDHLVAKHPELRASPEGMARMHGRRAFALAALGRRAEARRQAVEVLRRSPGERRAWVALVVGTGLVPADAVQQLANRVGRGI